MTTKDDKMIIKDQKQMEDLFKHRLEQFDDQRCKDLTIHNYIKGVSFYVVIRYFNINDKGDKNINVYILDKDSHERFKDEFIEHNHKGVEIIEDPFILGDTVTIHLLRDIHITD